VEQARQVARQTHAPAVQVQRAKLAVLLAEHPTISSIGAARHLHLHVQTVYKWRKRWAQEGFSLEDRPRSGRPRRFSPSGASQYGRLSL
jgi:transposase